MALEGRHLYFRYQKQQPWVLKDCSLKLERGECLALLGPSGYGKTTLAMLLSGYLTPTRGEILLENQPFPPNGPCPVQLIHQHPEKAINPRWKLRRVLEEGGWLQQDILEALGIQTDWLSRFPSELSAGELQRFCIARALLSGADYLICDEISSMLDVIAQAQIWNILLHQAQKHNMGILAITHNPHLAEKIAGRIQHCIH